jgi:hypothetical protein
LESRAVTGKTGKYPTQEDEQSSISVAYQKQKSGGKIARDCKQALV